MTNRPTKEQTDVEKEKENQYPVKDCVDCGAQNRKEDTVCYKCGRCHLVPARREDGGK